MSWILLLIQLVPAVLQIISAIRDLIAKLPKAEKAAAWKELKTISRQNVRKKRNADSYLVRTSEETVLEELQALHDKLKHKVVA